MILLLNRLFNAKWLLPNFQPVTVIQLDLLQCHVVQVHSALARQDIQAKLVQVAHLVIINQDLIAMVRFVCLS